MGGSMSDLQTALTGALAGRKILIEAKAIPIKAQTRREEISELVRQTFYTCAKHNRRSKGALFQAYTTADHLAEIGGEDYQDACSLLRWAFNSPADYAEACEAVQIKVQD